MCSLGESTPWPVAPEVHELFPVAPPSDSRQSASSRAGEYEGGVGLIPTQRAVDTQE
jgi:hypothetical protein